MIYIKVKSANEVLVNLARGGKMKIAIDKTKILCIEKVSIGELCFRSKEGYTQKGVQIVLISHFLRKIYIKYSK